jgi:hypothetical protein
LALRSSNKVYSDLYAKGDFIEELEFPSMSGQWKKRDFSDDSDILLDDVSTFKDNISRDAFLPFDGKIPNQDPIRDGHIIHPIEVVIDESTIIEMRDHARKVCFDGDTKELISLDEVQNRETGGYLAGKLMQDEHDRLWIHISKSIHYPEVIGDATEVTWTFADQGRWLSIIREEYPDLTWVGIWHSHPTYQPFQSDYRTWSGGADVQTTFRDCKGWWQVSMVIDPFVKIGEDLIGTAIGGYRIVKPGKSFTPEEPWEDDVMGWRSVSIAINKG